MIDHLIYGAPDLNDAVDDLKHNALLALGPRTYLEILAPEPDQPEPVNPRPFGIDDLTAPRLVGWAVGCHDIDAAIAASRNAGYDPGDAIEGRERRNSDDQHRRTHPQFAAARRAPEPVAVPP